MLLKFLKFLLFVLLALNILAWALYVFWPFDAQDFEEYERKKKAGMLFPKSDSENQENKAETVSSQTSNVFKMDQVQIKPVREAVSVLPNSKPTTSIKQWIATDGKKESDKLFDQIKAELPAKEVISSSKMKSVVSTVVAVPALVSNTATLIVEGDLKVSPPSTPLVKASFTVSRKDFKIETSTLGSDSLQKELSHTETVRVQDQVMVSNKPDGPTDRETNSHKISRENPEELERVESAANTLKISSSVSIPTRSQSSAAIKVESMSSTRKPTAEVARKSSSRVAAWPYQVTSVIQNPFDQMPVKGLKARLGKKSELLVRVPKRLIRHTIGSQLAQDHLEFWVHHPNVSPRDGYGSISYQFGIGLGRKPWVEEFLKTEPELKLSVEKRVLKNELEIIITGWSLPGAEWNLVFSKTAEVQGLWQQGIMQSLVPGFEWGQRQGLIKELQAELDQ